MFLCVTQWSDRCVLRQIFFVVVCVWALAPFVCLVCFSSWRNANLAGGFAGRPVFFVLFLVCCDLPALPDLLGPCTMMFYCLCSCKDRARVRHRPYSRKKKSWTSRSDICWQSGPAGLFLSVGPRCRPSSGRYCMVDFICYLELMVKQCAPLDSCHPSRTVHLCSVAIIRTCEAGQPF